MEFGLFFMVVVVVVISAIGCILCIKKWIDDMCGLIDYLHNKADRVEVSQGFIESTVGNLVSDIQKSCKSNEIMVDSLITVINRLDDIKEMLEVRTQEEPRRGRVTSKFENQKRITELNRKIAEKSER